MLLKMYEKLNVINILVMFIDKCNFSCVYCYNDKPRSNMQINTAQLIDFIKTVQKQTTKHIIVQLIGGEPTLHPNILEFCKYCKFANVDVQIFTNFSLSNQLYLDLLDLNVELIASWHYQYDIDAFLKNVNYIFNSISNPKCDIITMLDPIYFNIGHKLTLDLLKHNIRNVLPMMLDYDLKTNKVFYYTNNCTYSQEQLVAYNQLLSKCNVKKYFTAIYSDKIEKLSIVDVTKNNIYQKFKFWKCNAGMEYLYIDQYGDIYTCITTKKDKIRNKLLNIYNCNQFILPKKPIICKRNMCYCMWEVYKEKILKNY